MKILTTLFCGAVILLSSCATPMNTYTDRDVSVDFNNYHTFSWINKHPLSVRKQTPVLANPLMGERIQNAILQELTARGLKYVPVEGEADLVVSFRVGAHQEVNMNSFPVAYRSRGRWGGTYVGDSVDVHSTTEGTLAIDFFDSDTKSPVWHGRAERSLYKSDRAHTNELIKEAVAAILADFPSPAPENNS